MADVLSVSDLAMTELRQLLKVDSSVDWRAIELATPEAVTALDWAGLASESMLPLLKAYQRLLRILPVGEEHRALPLLESGLHSAIQIANLSRAEFARRWGALFPGEDALGLAVHRAALARRSELLLHHVHNVQHNEPYYRAARFK